MIHKGKNIKSRIASMVISAGRSRNCYRGLVQVNSRADNARNSSQCDSMIIGDIAAANTYLYIQISWTQTEVGSAVTWKYPSMVLEGDESVGEFYSVAFTNNRQQADTGIKMIHKGKNIKSRIVSKGISAGCSSNCYRGLVQVNSRADNARNSSQCDSMLIGDIAAANTYSYIQIYRALTQIYRSSRSLKEAAEFERRL
ncbi:hypothetical protein LXL04_030926 [Taraxacum kok-saghyz]